MSESGEISKNIKFKVQNFVDAPLVVVEAAQKAISMVWQKNVGEPVTVSVLFASRIVDKQGKDNGWSSLYDPDSDEFKFAVDTMKERVNLGLSDDERMILIAAHEAKHKVQCYKGDRPRQSPHSYNMDEQYYKDRHEKEAWEEALHVIKKLYPQASGRLIIGGRPYDVPRVSKY